MSIQTDGEAIDVFAQAMKDKMRAAQAKGRHGWDDPIRCPTPYLRRLLLDAVVRGDPIDVGNYAMMLHARHATTIDTTR